MLSKVLTAVGYVKAPKVTLLIRHPLRGGAALLAYRAAKRSAPQRRLRAMIAAAAAAAAVPVAVGVLRRAA
jgi:hypothetical protein